MRSMGARGSPKVLIARQPVLIARLRIQKRRSRYQYLMPISGPKAETQSGGCRTALRISLSLIRLRAYRSKGERGSGRGGCPPRSRARRKKKKESRRFLYFPSRPSFSCLLLPSLALSCPILIILLTHPTHVTPRKSTINNHEKKQRSRYGAIFFTCMLRSFAWSF